MDFPYLLRLPPPLAAAIRRLVELGLKAKRPAS
jgi:hypothetical protein